CTCTCSLRCPTRRISRCTASASSDSWRSHSPSRTGSPAPRSGRVTASSWTGTRSRRCGRNGARTSGAARAAATPTIRLDADQWRGCYLGLRKVHEHRDRGVQSRAPAAQAEAEGPLALYALRDRLPLDEAVDPGVQLSMLVRGFYDEGWRPGRSRLEGGVPGAHQGRVPVLWGSRRGLRRGPWSACSPSGSPPVKSRT